MSDAAVAAVPTMPAQADPPSIDPVADKPIDPPPVVDPPVDDDDRKVKPKKDRETARERAARERAERIEREKAEKAERAEKAAREREHREEESKRVAEARKLAEIERAKIAAETERERQATERAKAEAAAAAAKLEAERIKAEAAAKQVAAIDAKPKGSSNVLVLVLGPGVSGASREVIKSVYLGKSSVWPNGTTARPMNRPASSAAGRKFYGSVLGMSGGAFREHWSSLQLSGGGISPSTISSAETMVAKVAATRGGIGYVLESELPENTSGVKLVPLK